MDRPASPPTPPLPLGTSILTHQVGGHMFGKSKTKYGFLQFGGQTILKPLQEDDRGTRELQFYQTVFREVCTEETDDDAAVTNDILCRVRPLLPTFYGTWQAAEHPGVVYIHLEDVTKKFNKPCILDVKIGPITYNPYADSAKIERETSKYPPLQTVGFQLIGLRVYNSSTRRYTYLDRVHLRKLDEKEILTDGLALYLDMSSKRQKNSHILSALLRRLRVIEDWFSFQRRFVFYASSLLLVYEGATASTATCFAAGGCCLSSPRPTNTPKAGAPADDLVDVKMIDFAHVFAAEDEDQNYLTGLRSLIQYLEQLQSSAQP